ncbi:hypothetical protein PVK06_039621 [Gossypium arboreum]|uniref:Uncharacterized protein n=1 Tax=Gossypium arboreum TaxID=29729 RepID=A0ABR0N3L5_GOSAR|nr:hypothetical protein PVK06_039621 [Gossypium arboreum]
MERLDHLIEVAVDQKQWEPIMISRSGPDAFWVRILRSVHSLMPDDIRRSNLSYLWRSLMQIWDKVKEGIIWIIWDGHLVNIWNDDRVQELDPL